MFDKRQTKCYTPDKGVMRLSAVFGFRLQDDLRQYLQARADAQRTTISHYLITLVLKDMQKEREKKNEKD